MARQVDPARKSQRDNFIATVSFVASDARALSDKSLELMERMRGVVDDRSGANLFRDLGGSMEAVRRSVSYLEQALQAAQGIDITVEVPDDGMADQWRA